MSYMLGQGGDDEKGADGLATTHVANVGHLSQGWCDAEMSTNKATREEPLSRQ